MELLINSLLIIHVSAGFMSIVLFWIPMFSKKGGELHKKSGKWYVYSMWVVVITAAILSIKNVCVARYNMAIFLGFISLITSGPLWYAIAILNQKKGRTPAYRKKLLLFNIMVVCSAIAMIIYGLNISDGTRVLMFIFGGLGLTSLPDVVRELRNNEKKLNWIQEHAIGMITIGIAAYTAFFVFGANRAFGQLLPGSWSILPWVAPGIIGTFANFYYGKKYATKKA